MSKGGYRGGSTVISPGSGWFTFNGRKKAKAPKPLVSEKAKRKFQERRAKRDIEADAERARLATIGSVGPRGTGLIKPENMKYSNPSKRRMAKRKVKETGTGSTGKAPR